VFDAFFSVYINRTRDLMRIAYPDGRASAPNFLHADLANRLAEEAAKTAMSIQNICLRAIDYCPPVDITFGDYLRALVTSDRDAVADDSKGYRAALVNAFRARGIRPEGVISYSDEALAWEKYEGTSSVLVNPDFKRLFAALNKFEDDPDAENEQQLYERLWSKADTFAMELGLSPSPDTPIQARSLNPLHQIRPDGSLQRRIVAELVQQEKNTLIDLAKPEMGKFTFRGGTTVLINRNGEVQYSISKPIAGPEGEKRRKRQQDYLKSMADSFVLGAHITFDARRESGLRGIHRGF